MSVISRGFRVLRAEDVRVEPWSVRIGESDPLTMPSSLPDWTFYQPLKIRVTLIADLQELQVRLGLGQDARLGAVIIWGSLGTSLRGASDVLTIEPNETTVSLDLDGSLLRGALDLECQVLLVEPGTRSDDLLSPSNRGSILWTSKYTIDLEGTGARMPTIALPFSTQLIGGEHGLWWLRVASRDFHAQANSVLWLWLNEENLVIRELLDSPSSDGSVRTQELLRLDIYRQLIEIGLLDSEFSLDETYAQGSLGAVVAGPVRLLGESLNTLRQLHDQDAPRLNAQIQAAFGGLQ